MHRELGGDKTIKPTPMVRRRFTERLTIGVGGNRHWEFAVEDTEKTYSDGKPLVLSLCRAFDIPVRRHIKIKGEANPFDPKFRTYFEERRFSKRGVFHKDQFIALSSIIHGH